MHSLSIVASPTRTLAARRLARALAIEAYFRHLWDKHPSDEVHRQWAASRRLLQVASQPLLPAKSRPAAGAE